MKSTILILFGLAAAAFGAPPSQPNLTRYTTLWTDSPFTAKPPPPEPTGTVNPFEGYSLGGISKLEDGYFGILLNDKDPEKKEVIRPGHKSEFEIVEVNWSETNWRDTTVKVKRGSQVGTLAFDSGQLTLSAPVAAAPRPAVATPNPAANNAPNNQAPNGNERRRPRPRVVVPPKK